MLNMTCWPCSRLMKLTRSSSSKNFSLKSFSKPATFSRYSSDDATSPRWPVTSCRGTGEWELKQPTPLAFGLHKMREISKMLRCICKVSFYRLSIKTQTSQQEAHRWGVKISRRALGSSCRRVVGPPTTDNYELQSTEVHTARTWSWSEAKQASRARAIFMDNESRPPDFAETKNCEQDKIFSKIRPIRAVISHAKIHLRISKQPATDYYLLPRPNLPFETTHTTTFNALHYLLPTQVLLTCFENDYFSSY